MGPLLTFACACRFEVTVTSVSLLSLVSRRGLFNTRCQWGWVLQTKCHAIQTNVSLLTFLCHANQRLHKSSSLPLFLPIQTSTRTLVATWGGTAHRNLRHYRSNTESPAAGNAWSYQWPREFTDPASESCDTVSRDTSGHERCFALINKLLIAQKNAHPRCQLSLSWFS